MVEREGELDRERERDREGGRTCGEGGGRVHGGIDVRELRAHGLHPESIADFSVNVNPYGPCVPVLEAVRAAALDRYPDPEARCARAAWAKVLARDPEQLAVGHGANDLFWAIARALLVAGERVVIAEPTYSEFAFAAASVGARVERVRAGAERNFRLDLLELVARARGARALYLCSPNNPTGEHLPSAAIAELAGQLPMTTIVLDHSFIGLSDHTAEARAPLPDNVVMVRSLTKEFACPGLRIGLCAAAPALIRRFEAARPTWATSSPALAALEVSAGAGEFVRASWRRLRADRAAVTELLMARGFAPLASATSYQLVPLSCEARLLRARLLTQGVLVRECASFGLPRHMRVAALPAAARVRLAAALDAVRLA